MDEIRRLSYQVDILSPDLRISGRVEPIGPWIDFLNNPDRHTLLVSDAHVCPLGNGNHAFDQAQVVVNKHNICIIVVLDENAHEAFQLLRNTKRAISHIGPYICRSDFHMGVEASLVTFIDEMHGDFFAATDADLYCTMTTPSPLPSHAPLMIMNRKQMRLHHAA